MSEPIPESVLLWWMVLVLSVAMMVYEMIRWFLSRTVKLETWVDSPRIQPPGEEVKELTEWIRSFSKDEAASFEFRKRILNDITDTVTLVLGLDEGELMKLILNDSFVRKNFSSYESIVAYLSRSEKTQLPDHLRGRAKPDPKIDVSALIDDTVVLLDQVSRWEEKHENSGSK